MDGDNSHETRQVYLEITKTPHVIREALCLCAVPWLRSTKHKLLTVKT